MDPNKRFFGETHIIDKNNVYPQITKRVEFSPSSLTKSTNVSFPAKSLKEWNYHWDTMSAASQQALNHANDLMIRRRPSAYSSDCKSPVGLNMMHLRHVIVDLSPTLTLAPFFHRLREEVAELRAVVAHSRPVLKLMIYPLFVQIVNATSIKPLVMITIII